MQSHGVLDDVEEFVDEPNFNNHNTSPHPPSPYADLEKKYRKNRFYKSRPKATGEYAGMINGNVAPVSRNVDGNKVQKRKPRKKNHAKSFRPPSGKKSS